MGSARKIHKPQRTCVGCRNVLEKRSLIRLVRTANQEVEIDLSSKDPGRGAYLHDDPECWEKGLNGKLEKALNVTLSSKNIKEIRMFLTETIIKN